MTTFDYRDLRNEWLSEVERLTREQMAARIEKLEAVARAAREYEREWTNPAPDLAYRANRRKNLFATLASLDTERGEEER